MASTFIIGSIVKRLIAAFKSVGITVTMTSGLRTYEQQAGLWEDPGAYPVAQPGNSQHEYGVAVDLHIEDQYLPTLVEVWRILGFYWDSDDKVHFSVFSPDQWQQILPLIRRPVIVEEMPVYKKKAAGTPLYVPASIGFLNTALGFPQASPFELPYQGLGYDVPYAFSQYSQAGTKAGFEWVFKAAPAQTAPKLLEAEIKREAEILSTPPQVAAVIEAAFVPTIPAPAPVQVEQPPVQSVPLTSPEPSGLLEQILGKLERSRMSTQP